MSDTLKKNILKSLDIGRKIIVFYYELIEDKAPESILDATGIPTGACPTCGSKAFDMTVAWGGDPPRIRGYKGTAQCHKCNTLLTPPLPTKNAPMG